MLMPVGANAHRDFFVCLFVCLYCFILNLISFPFQFIKRLRPFQGIPSLSIPVAMKRINSVAPRKAKKRRILSI